VQRSSKPPPIDDGLDVFGVNIAPITSIVASRRRDPEKETTGCTQGSGLAARQPADRGQGGRVDSKRAERLHSCDRSRGGLPHRGRCIGSRRQHVSRLMVQMISRSPLTRGNGEGLY